MAFLDETGLAELWRLIKAEDAKAPKIVTGSYVGTGTYGSSNPCRLTFDFAPTIVGIYAIGSAAYSGSTPVYNYAYDPLDSGAYSSVYMLPMQELPTECDEYRSAGWYKGMSTGGRHPGWRSEDGKTLYWYSTTEAIIQFNNKNYTYFYFAIA